MTTDRTILLVEDNQDDEALALRALSKNRIHNRVVVARDGVEALDYLFGPAGITPSLVLLDLKLPRLDGLELLRRIRADERTRLLPVTILTTSLEQQDIQEAYTLGANSYVRKPVDFAEFIEAVGQLAAYWLSLNQPLASGPGGAPGRRAACPAA